MWWCNILTPLPTQGLQELQEHLQSHQECHQQPYLLASGTSKQAISAFYIVMDKRLIPCQGTTSLAALDKLFKVRFVFSVSYADALNNLYTFLQTTVCTQYWCENHQRKPKGERIKS